MNKFKDSLTGSQLKFLNYIDTVNFFYQRFHPTKLIYALIYLGNRLIVRDYYTKDKRFLIGTWIQVQQPTIKELIFVRDLTPNDPSRVDLAYDYLTKTPTSLQYEFVKTNKLKYSRKGDEKNNFKGTIYFKRNKNASTNLVIYSDMISKVTGEECCHVEIRVKGSRAVKAQHLTLDELIDGPDYDRLFNKFVGEVKPVKASSNKRLIGNKGLDKRLKSADKKA